jgi:hypothetical protein
MVVEPGNDLGLLCLATKTFPDFTLRLEFQLGRIDDNSGIFVRFQKGKRTSFRKAPCELFVAPKRRRKKTLIPDEPDTFDAVSLFSGGLDSLIGVMIFSPQTQQRAYYCWAITMRTAQRANREDCTKI